MASNVFLIILAQLFFSIADTFKRFSSAGKPFTLALLKDPAYLLGLFILPTIGYVVLLYVLTRFELSRAIPVLGMSAVILSMIFGAVFLKEQLTVWNLAGGVLALVAIYLVSLR